VATSTSLRDEITEELKEEMRGWDNPVDTYGRDLLATAATRVISKTLDAQQAEIERLTRDLAKMQEIAAGAYTIPTATEQGVEERLRETLAPYLDNFPEGEAGEILPSIMHVIVPVLSHQQAAHRRDLVRNANKTKILCAELENTQRELDALRNERNTPPDSPTDKDNVADTSPHTRKEHRR
jgi:uncharacterized coiled-coil protein SlyX